MRLVNTDGKSSGFDLGASWVQPLLCRVIFPKHIFVVFLNSLILEIPVDHLRRSKVSLDSLWFMRVKFRCEKGEMWSAKTADVCTREHAFPWTSYAIDFFFIHFVTLGPDDFNARQPQTFQVSGFLFYFINTIFASTIPSFAGVLVSRGILWLFCCIITVLSLRYEWIAIYRCFVSFLRSGCFNEKFLELWKIRIYLS